MTKQLPKTDNLNVAEYIVERLAQKESTIALVFRRLRVSNLRCGDSSAKMKWIGCANE